jgi:hypothetical protein
MFRLSQRLHLVWGSGNRYRTSRWAQMSSSAPHHLTCVMAFTDCSANCSMGHFPASWPSSPWKCEQPRDLLWRTLSHCGQVHPMHATAVLEGQFTCRSAMWHRAEQGLPNRQAMVGKTAPPPPPDADQGCRESCT